MSERRVALLHQAGTAANPCIARRLARSGHDLVLHAPRAGMAEELLALGASVEVIDEAEVPGSGLTSDATPAGAQVLVDRALARFGRLDAAALIAPRGGGRTLRGPLLQAPTQDIDLMGGYLAGTCHLLRAVIPAMRGRGGQILVFTSDAGARPAAGWSLYGAARAAQNFLVQAAALEHAAEGVCINAMGSKNAMVEGFPGAPREAITDGSVVLGDWAAPLLAETPLGRLGTMEEMAAFAISLLDGTNRFQTGQYLSFSGGWNVA